MSGNWYDPLVEQLSVCLKMTKLGLVPKEKYPTILPCENNFLCLILIEDRGAVVSGTLLTLIMDKPQKINKL
mgnify:CR=1 FL=1